MTPPQPILRIRREALGKALHLPAAELRVLVYLMVHACPTTGRVWEPPDRIATSLDFPLSLVEDALHGLAGRDFLEEYPALMRQLRCVELGEVFLRSMPAPPNVPTEKRL